MNKVVKPILIELDSSLWRNVKSQAALEGKTTKKLVADILRKYLEVNNK